jgi:hypothetical protein
VFVGGQGLRETREGETRCGLRRSFGKESQEVHMQKTPDQNTKKDKKMRKENM